MKRDYYDVLGVARDADEQAIKKAFRKLARRFHPDVNTEDPEAEAKFKEAAEAYEVLSNPDSRAAYDRYGFDGLKGRAAPDFSGFGFADLFDAFFGGGDMFGSVLRDAAPRGEDLHATVELDLREAVFGTVREVEVKGDVACETCGGTGAVPGTGRETCPQCHGSGRVREVSSLGGFGQFIRTSTCPLCRGQGTIVKQPCETCRGTGKQRRVKKVKVEIPAGIDDGQRLRLTGDGGAGGPGARPGDLYVLVRVRSDDHVVRDGNDLIYRLDVTMVEAALGAKFKIPVLDGEIDVTLAPGTQPGEVKVHRNRGVPVLNGYGRGDLKVIINVTIPRHLTSEQRELLERLGQLLTAKNYEADEGFFDKLRAAFRQ